LKASSHASRDPSRQLNVGIIVRPLANAHLRTGGGP